MTQHTQEAYRPKNQIRIVTAGSLFDGHDAAINIMRRMLQSSGAEIIHLGHNRSVQDIVDCAIQEDANAVAVTSYQGGHLEFFKYMHDLFKARSAAIKIFGGGGGTILPTEIDELHAYGITRIYSPDDGRQMGLQGMINDLLEKCDRPVTKVDMIANLKRIHQGDLSALPATLTCAENHPESLSPCSDLLGDYLKKNAVPVLGITGTGGSGKSSLVDEFLNRFLSDFADKTVAVISVDPSRRKTGGALLGDRIRMNAIQTSRVYMRSVATRESNRAISRAVQSFIDICKAANFSLIIVETSGIGQSDSEIVQHSDHCLYVMTPEYGAAASCHHPVTVLLQFSNDRCSRIASAEHGSVSEQSRPCIHPQPWDYLEACRPTIHPSHPRHHD
jgi:methylmalonyl-CoA mutase